MRQSNGFTLLLFLLPFLACHSQSSPVWNWTLESRCYARPLLSGSQLFVVSQAGEVVAGNPSNGNQSWSTRVGGQILAEPVLQEDRLFAATENGLVLALDTHTGRILWQKQQESDGFSAPLAVQDDLLLAPSYNGTLYALSVKDGHPIWNVPGNRKYSAGAVTQGQRIFIGGWGKEFLSVNRDGTVNWRFRTGQIVAEDAVLAKNTVYFSAYDDYVYGVDAISGRLIWRFPAAQPTRPYLIHGSLIFASGQDFYVLRPEDGQVIRRISTRSKILRCSVTNDRLLFASGKTGLYELDPATPAVRPLVEPPFALFKWSCQDTVLVASDQQYGIHGFTLQK